MALISYAQAVAHLKQTGVLDVSPQDADLELKVRHAEAIVLGYVNRFGEFDENSDTETDTDFGYIQAAILKVLGNLYRFRGDDDKSPSPLSDDVLQILLPLKGHTLA